MTGAEARNLTINPLHCTGGRRAHQHFLSLTWQTARRAGAQTNSLKINSVNCGWQAQRTTNHHCRKLHGRQAEQGSDNQPGKLPGGRCSAETKDLTISLVNCTGGRRRAQGSDNQSLGVSTGGRRRHHHFQNQPGQLQGGRRRSKSFDKRSRKLHGWQAQRPGI